MSYIKKLAVRQLINKHGLRASIDLYKALDKAIETALAVACARAQKNKRVTVMPHDL